MLFNQPNRKKNKNEKECEDRVSSNPRRHRVSRTQIHTTVTTPMPNPAMNANSTSTSR